MCVAAPPMYESVNKSHNLLAAIAMDSYCRYDDPYGEESPARREQVR